MKKLKILLFGNLLLAAMLAGCSSDEEPGAADKQPAKEAQQVEEEAEKEAEKEAPAEPAMPEAAVHNVEKIVKEKGKYDARNQMEEIQKELEAAPDGMTGEEAYSLIVSLIAPDLEEPAAKFEAIDPVITIDSATPEDQINLPEQETVNVAVLLDASGSMAGEVSGGQKMKLAKQAIQKYAGDLPEGSNVMLRIYGHKGEGTNADKEMSCSSNEVVYDLSAYDEPKFTAALEAFAPAGWTPLAGAIEAAEQDLQEQKGDNIRNVIYVVSDGIETCGGDPVAAAASLSGSGIEAEVNIIGFDVDNEGQKQLEEVAKAGKGQHKSVYSESELNEYLKQEYSRLYWEWLAWGNDRYLDILQQSNNIYGDLLKYNNDIYGKSLASLNDMYSMSNKLINLGKFKDEEAATKYKELIETRHETVTQYFRQEQERKDTIRKDMHEKLEAKVKQLQEESEENYGS